MLKIRILETHLIIEDINYTEFDIMRDQGIDVYYSKDQFLIKGTKEHLYNQLIKLSFRYDIELV